MPLPSTSSERNSSKVAGTSPDNCAVSGHRGSSEEKGRDPEEKEQGSRKPSLPAFQLKGIKSRQQPSFIASRNEENEQPKNSEVLIPKISISIDDETVNTKEYKTNV